MCLWGLPVETCVGAGALQWQGPGWRGASGGVFWLPVARPPPMKCGVSGLCVHSGALVGGLMNFSYVIAFRTSTLLFFWGFLGRWIAWKALWRSHSKRSSLQTLRCPFFWTSHGAHEVGLVCSPCAPLFHHLRQESHLTSPSSGTLGDYYWPRSLLQHTTASPARNNTGKKRVLLTSMIDLPRVGPDLGFGYVIGTRVPALLPLGWPQSQAL